MAIVLWALIALAGLSLGAAVTSRVDLALARNYRDHAAALALAEAGLAEALATLASASESASSGTTSGDLKTGSFTASWTSAGDGFLVRASGSSGTAVRTVEAAVAAHPNGGLRIAAWREIR